MSERDIEIWNLTFEGVKTFGLIAGAGWAAWRFRRERTHAPQIQFSVDAILHGPSNGAYAAEYVLTFENKGKTRVQITKIELRVRGIKANTKLKDWARLSPRLEFPHLLVSDDKVMPANYGYTFFEPGIKQEYRYISKVPVDFRFILVRGQFYYDKDHPHSAERLITVEA